MKSSRRCNIRMVARKAGVSAATVSRVLNNQAVIPVKTRTRVMRVVHELNYQPDPAFRQAFRRCQGNTPAVEGRTGLIGFLSYERIFEGAAHGDGYYSRILNGIQKECRNRSLHPLLITCGADAVSPPELILEKRVDGVLVEGTFPELLFKVLIQMLPVVFIDRCYPELAAGSVMPNIEQAVVAELNHLWNLGHRNIVTFQPAAPMADYEVYRRAFARFFSEKHCAVVHPELCQPREILTETHAPVMAEYARQLVEARPRPTAVVAYDIYVHTLSQELQRLGVRVPEDVSLVGMDDTAEARLSSPPLTSCRFPLDELGRTAVELLAQSIENLARPVRHVLVNGRLIERKSCAPAG